MRWWTWLAVDREWIGERFRGGIRHVGHLTDLGTGRSHFECPAESLERAPCPTGPHLDVATGKVGDPAAQAEPSGLLTHEPPEPHTLNAAGDAYVKEAHVCCSQPWVPNR